MIWLLALTAYVVPPFAIDRASIAVPEVERT